MKRIVLLLICLLLLSLIVPVQAQEEGTGGTFSFEDIERSYYILVPESVSPDEPTPLVLMLHGRGTDGRSMAAASGMDAIAEKEGFIALYPDGLRSEWNYLRGFDFYLATPHNDTAFIRALIDHIDEQYSLDHSRIYVAGLSNGGFMAQRLACEAADLFAGAASVAATAYTGLEILCEDTPPTAIMLVHGTDDPIVPWDGNSMQNEAGNTLWLNAPAPETLAFWAGHNGCSPDFARENLVPSGASPETRVVHLMDQGCDPGGAVSFYGIIGGGHTWPGIVWPIADLVGPVNMDFNASEAIWSFFAAHPMMSGE